MLEELRSLNESTKRQILVASTIIVMVGIVYLWLGYFNGLITPVSEPLIAENQPQQNSPGYALVQGMKNGFANIANGFGNIAQWFAGFVQNAGQYVIRPK